MPYTKETLQGIYSLTSEDVEATFIACGLPSNSDCYSEQEIQSGFDIIRSYFTNGQVTDYQQASVLFKQQTNKTEPLLSGRDAKNKKSKKSQSEPEFAPKIISELLLIASQQTAKNISLAQAINILRICGLNENALHYSERECSLFLEACTQILVSEKSPQEVVDNLGITQNHQFNDLELEHVVESISNEAIKTSEALETLVDKITLNQAGDIAGRVRQSYLKNVAYKLQSDNSTEEFFAHLEQRIIARIEGKKSQGNSQLSGVGWETKVLPPSLGNSLQEVTPSPDVFENGTTTD